MNFIHSDTIGRRLSVANGMRIISHLRFVVPASASVAAQPENRNRVHKRRDARCKSPRNSELICSMASSCPCFACVSSTP